MRDRGRSKRNILTNNDWEFSNISLTKQTTDPGSSANTKQKKHPLTPNLHPGIPYLKCGQPSRRKHPLTPNLHPGIPYLNCGQPSRRKHPLTPNLHPGISYLKRGQSSRRKHPLTPNLHPGIPYLKCGQSKMIVSLTPNLHPGISYLKCGQSKTKVFERSQKPKRPSLWRNNNKNYIELVFTNHASKYRVQ